MSAATGPAYLIVGLGAFVSMAATLLVLATYLKLAGWAGRRATEPVRRRSAAAEAGFDRPRSNRA